MDYLLFTFEDAKDSFEYLIKDNALKVRITDDSNGSVVEQTVSKSEDWHLFLTRFKTFYNEETYIEDEWFDILMTNLSQLRTNVISAFIINRKESGIADFFVRTESNLSFLIQFRQDYDPDGLYREVEVYTDNEALSVVQKEKEQVEHRLNELVLLEKQLTKNSY